MSRGYSVAQTARLVCALRWACSRLSDILDVWAVESAASTAPGSAVASVCMAELSRRIASHREMLDGLQPDSVRMDAWRQAAPGDPSLSGVLGEIAATQGPVERLQIARQVMVPQLVGAYAGICEHAAPHSDGALASAACALRHELDGVLSDGGAARTVAFPPDAARSEVVAAARRRLVAVGGVVGSSLLRPGAWP